VLFAVVFFNSGIVGGSASNPFGIKGVSEILTLFYLLFACGYLLHQYASKTAIYKIDISIFVVVISGILYSAIAAKISFGQPVYYGLFEQRRLLILLIYFPLVWGFRNNIVSVTQIMNWIFVVALLCGVLSVLVATGVVDPINVHEIGESSLREDRYSIGKFYLIIGSLFALYRLSFEKNSKYIYPLLFLVGVLVIVVQTRQLLIALVIASAFMLGTARSLAWGGAAILSIAVAANTSSILLELLAKYQMLFMQLAAEEYLEASARARTIDAIINELASGLWFGFGALSARWNEGFARIYDANFFLSDVGVFGTAYVFGLFAIVLYGTYLYWQYRLVKASKQHRYYRLLVAVWAFLIVIIPVGATLEYRGTVAGLLLALSLGCVSEISRRNGIARC
jgi:hypothetical protein